MPIVIFIIIILGLAKKVPIFDTFLKGAKEGMYSTASILPALVGLVTAVSMLKASGALDIFTSFVEPLVNFFGIPSEVVPLMFLRPVSGSGSIAIIDNIFANYGTDSFISRVASVMMGSTETTFYAIAIYFGAVGIKNTRHAVPSALAADAISYIVATLSVKLLFYT